MSVSASAPDAAAADPAAPVAGETLFRQALRRFVRHRLALVGLGILLVVSVLAIFAPLIATHDPTALDLRSIRQAPSGAHLLGTDNVGYDVWSRLVYGARVSLVVGFGSVAIAVVAGAALGILGGYYGGWVDQVIGRVIDMVQSIPSILLAIVVVAIVGPSLPAVILVIALVSWPGAARLVRGQVLSLREADFVTASRVVGVRTWRILARHLLPNVLGPLTVAATFGVASAILVEASLSFLGLGVRPPEPTWGGMVSLARNSDVLINQPWAWAPAAGMIALTVLAVNFVGDGLRDAVDPRSSRRV